MARPEDASRGIAAGSDGAEEAARPTAPGTPAPSDGAGAAEAPAGSREVAAAEALEAAPWQSLAEGWEREAAARGEDPSAAPLWHEAGLVYEERLSRPRQAAACYQTAFRLDPGYRPNLRSARRLFAAAGSWSMVAQLLQAEVEVTTDPRVRSALLLERAAVLRERLGRGEEAAAVLADARAAAPDDLGLMAYVATAAARDGDVEALAAAWRDAAGATDDPALRVAWLSAAAGLTLDHLGDEETAWALYEEAHRLDPRHPAAIEALLRLAEQRGDHERRVALLEAAAGAAPSPGEAAVSLHQAARVAREVLGHQEEATRLLEAARRQAPGDPAILDELSYAYESAGRDEARAEVLAALADRTRDPRARVEVLHRLGRLLDEGLGRVDDAAAAYRRILEDAPGSGEALGSLGRLYARAGRWEDLVWTFRQEIAATEDPRQRATRLFRIAEIQRTRLADVEGALATLHQALDLYPGYPPALAALAAVYREREAWDALVALHERALSAVGDDPPQRIHLLEQMGRLQEERLGDPEAAVRTAERILAEAPDHLPTVRRLQQLHERLERWPDLVASIEREAELVADQRQAVALLQRACELREERLGDRDDAISGWQRVLALQPTYLPALRALGRLYQQKGRWAELASMYRQELEVAPADQAVPLLLRIARLEEERLLDEAAAIETYRRILDHRPDALVALRALRRLQARRGALEELVAVLRQEAAVVQDPDERARLFCAAAEVRERTGARDRAVAFYRQALDEVPGHVQALGALARLYGAADAWRELARVYEQTLSAAPPGRRSAVWHRLAHLYLDRLGAPERAVQCLEAVLAETPEDALSLLQLERVRLALGELEPALQSGGRLADVAETAPGGAALLQGVALTGEAHAADGAALPWARILKLDPDHVLAASRMEAVARGAGDDRALVALLTRRRARAESDTDRASLSMRIADAAERLGDPAAAEAGYREVLALDPDHLPALRGLRQLLSSAGRWTEVRPLLDRELAGSRDEDRVVALALQAARLCRERLGDAEGSEAALRRVLALRPEHEDAWHGLRDLLSGAERWEALVDAAAARAPGLADPEDRAEAWAEVSRWRRDRLDEPRAALTAAEAALEARPGRPDLLELSADLAWHLEDWALAARRYAGRIEAGGPDDALRRARLRLAEFHRTQQPDPQRAMAHLEDALRASPDDPEILRRLAELQTADARWEAAAGTLARLAELEEDPALRRDASLQLAAIQAGRLGAPSEAVETLERVRALDPDHLGAAERLAALYEATRQWGPLVEIYRELVRLLPEGARDRAWAIHARRATVLSDHLDDPEAAAQAWRDAVALRPDDSGARQALAELRAARPEGWGEAVAQHRAILAHDPDRLESLQALFELFARREAWDEAWCAASLLEALEVGDQASADLLAFLRPCAPGSDHPAALTPEDHATRLSHPAARGPLAEVFAAVGNHLARLHPQELDAFGVGRSDRILPRDASPLRTLTDGLMATLGGGEYALYRTERPGRIVEVLAGDPPAVLVSGDLLRRDDPASQRFLLARVLEQARTGTGLVTRLDPPALAALVQACLEAVGADGVAVAPSDPDLTRRLARSLSRKARRGLQGPAARLAGRPAPDAEQYVEGVRRSLDRVGALLCGSPGTALRWVASEGGWRPGRAEGRAAVADLLAFVLGEDFFRLRRSLGLAVTRDPDAPPA